MFRALRHALDIGKCDEYRRAIVFPISPVKRLSVGDVWYVVVSCCSGKAKVCSGVGHVMSWRKGREVKWDGLESQAGEVKSS